MAFPFPHAISRTVCPVVPEVETAPTPVEPVVDRIGYQVADDASHDAAGNHRDRTASGTQSRSRAAEAADDDRIPDGFRVGRCQEDLDAVPVDTDRYIRLTPPFDVTRDGAGIFSSVACRWIGWALRYASTAAICARVAGWALI